MTFMTKMMRNTIFVGYDDDVYVCRANDCECDGNVDDGCGYGVDDADVGDHESDVCGVGDNHCMSAFMT